MAEGSGFTWKPYKNQVKSDVWKYCRLQTKKQQQGDETTSMNWAFICEYMYRDYVGKGHGGTKISVTLCPTKLQVLLFYSHVWLIASVQPCVCTAAWEDNRVVLEHAVICMCTTRMEFMFSCSNLHVDQTSQNIACCRCDDDPHRQTELKQDNGYVSMHKHIQIKVLNLI